MTSESKKNIFGKLIGSISDYPGLWINIVGIFTAILIVHGEVNKEIDTGEIKYLAAKTALNDAAKQYYNNRDKDIYTVLADVEGELLELLSKTTEENILIKYANDDDLYNRRIFIDNLYLVLVLNAYVINMPDNSSYATMNIDRVAEKIKNYYYNESTYYKNIDIYKLWILAAFMYIMLVFVAYHTHALTPNSGEYVLNVVDLGLYFSLIGYSGGLFSPVVNVLGVSLAVSGVALLSTLGTGGISSVREFLQDAKEGIKLSVPTLFYLFALSFGFFWAGVESDFSKDLTLFEFCINKSMLPIVWGVIIGVLVYAVKSIIRDSPEIEKTVPA